MAGTSVTAGYAARQKERAKKKKKSSKSSSGNTGMTVYNPDGSVAHRTVGGKLVEGSLPTSYGIDKKTGNVVGASNDNKRKSGGGYEAVQADPTLEMPKGNVADLANTPALPTSTYSGDSIVDFLASTGQPTDFGSRSKLAQQFGIQNYTGTAQQNTVLLNTLRSKGGTNPNAITDNANKLANTGLQGTVDTGAEGESTFRTELDSVLGDLGIDRNNIGQAPEKTFADVYEQTLKDLGLPDIKEQFETIKKDYENIQNELAEKVGFVNDNPWLTEGIRVKQIQKLNDKYETKLKDLTTRMDLFKDLYDEGQSNAKFLAQKMYDEQGKAGDFNEELLKKAIDIAERRATASQKGGFTSGALKYTDQDFAQDEAQLDQSRGTDGYVDPTLYQNLYKAWVANGGLLKDFLSHFPPKNYVNPANTWLPVYLMPSGARDPRTGTQYPARKTTTTRTTSSVSSDNPY